MQNDNPKRAPKWGLIAVAILLVPVLGIGLVVVNTWLPLREAGRANEQLEARFGVPGSYTPPADGAIPAERIEAFLQVQRALVQNCEDYEPIRQSFQHVAGLDEKEPGFGEAWKTAELLFDASRKITPFVGRFFEERNRALVAAGLSLDEYNYLYVCTFREQLGSAEVRNELFSDELPPSPELMTSLRAMVERQHAASSGEMQGSLAREMEQMSADPARYPWQHSLPPNTERSIQPYREALDELFCSGTAGIAMDRDSGRAIHIALE